MPSYEEPKPENLKIDEILARPEVRELIKSIKDVSNQGKPDYSMLRTDKVAINPDSKFATLSPQDQALVDQQIQRNLHTARDIMGYPDRQSVERGFHSSSSHMFLESRQLIAHHKNGTTSTYVAEYTNNARESFANDPKLIEGLRRNEEATRQQEATQGR